ncbi:protein translocase subunit SecF [Leucobacter chinensis]|uniref:protein translocase subunit SecF n=1 Tax=Leucobacter chinensis TaxID=2851010 RepID=UPI001C24438E|nr:protein translocase subunit SecF [Leucobacter chinensis]
MAGGFAKLGNDLYTGDRSVNFVGRRGRWYLLSTLVIVLALLGTLLRGGFSFGIEFTGGSEFQVHTDKVSQSDIQVATDVVTDVLPGSVPRVTTLGQNTVRLQTEQLDEKQSREIGVQLAEAFDIDESAVTSSYIGATWGQDITKSALKALIVFILFAGLVMALYFRTWKMALAALIALFHDLVITAAVYGAAGFEITPAAMIGFLTILGYSLYDTVVVFDKIRENTDTSMFTSQRTFGESVNLAVNQTLVRSINTSVVALLPVGSILFIGAMMLGAGTLRDITLALFIGIFVGAYSTIFIAAPVYAQLREKEDGIIKHDETVRKTREREATSTSIA